MKNNFHVLLILKERKFIEPRLHCFFDSQIIFMSHANNVIRQSLRETGGKFLDDTKP